MTKHLTIITTTIINHQYKCYNGHYLEAASLLLLVVLFFSPTSPSSIPQLSTHPYTRQTLQAHSLGRLLVAPVEAAEEKG